MAMEKLRKFASVCLKPKWKWLNVVFFQTSLGETPALHIFSVAHGPSECSTQKNFEQ